MATAAERAGFTQASNPMSETSHTPGPWSVDEEETGTNVWSADKHCVAECGPRRDYANGMGVCRANANLIAAAPALLAACKAIRSHLQAHDTLTIEHWQQLHAAIQQAEGGTGCDT